MAAINVLLLFLAGLIIGLWWKNKIVVQKGGFKGEGDKVSVLEQKNEITSNLSFDSQTGKKSTFKQNLFPLLEMTELPFFVFCFVFVLFFCLFVFCFVFVL